MTARAQTALRLVDMQTGFDQIEASGFARNNPDANCCIVVAFCGASGRVVHIHHANG
jgi:hypothetical protein